MSKKAVLSLPSLYEQDETAWLELTAQLISQRRYKEIDHKNLSEYLSDMARRDKREVVSRLVNLMAHLLKWEHHAEQRSNSWRGTILSQRRELRELLESGTLRRYAGEVFERAYEDARKQAAAETGLELQAFPADFSMSLDEVIAEGDA